MLTPETIASRRFDKQVGGYKQDEVEMFLQQVAGEYAKLLSEKEDLEEKIEVLAEKVEQYREDEDSLRSALIGAQKLGDSVIRESKSKAEYILREAQAQADQILENAQKSIEKEQMALIKMQKEVTKFKNRLLTLYRQHLEMISALPEYDNEPAREPAAEPKQPQPEAAKPADPQPQEPIRREQLRDNRETAPEKTEPDHFNEEPLIDFSSALGDEMQETTSFAPIGQEVQNMPAPAAREAAPAGSASPRSQGYSPFGAASAESKFGPLKFGEGFDVERDSASKSGGLFSRKKHR